MLAIRHIGVALRLRGSHQVATWQLMLARTRLKQRAYY